MATEMWFISFEAAPEISCRFDSASTSSPGDQKCAMGFLLFMLIMMLSRTLAAPLFSPSNAATISPSMDEVPSEYSPTAPPLELTVYPSSQAGQTVTVTQPAYTATVTSPPQTSVVTITASTSKVPKTSSTLLPSGGSSPRPTEWSLPLQFSSMDEAFSIEHYAFGRENVKLSTVNRRVIEASTEDSTPGTDQTILEVTYPRGSYSPSHEPRGGTDFYAVPSFSQSSDPRRNLLDSSDAMDSLRTANNVTMSYSVFFPDTFDFVKGGKLPGLYGGHEKCSGGDDGLGCFSTRLMWRGGGKGELYLYAPKDQQPPSLCSTPPRSICDSVYGFSIGRGSFTFARGGWTYVRQTVWLNTPGSANGGFVLQVGKGAEDSGLMTTVMSSAEVFYRDENGSNDGGGGDFESASIDDLYSEDDEPGRIAYESVNEWNPVGNILSVEANPSSPVPHVPSSAAEKATVYIVQGTQTITVPNYQTVTVTKTFYGSPTTSPIIVHPPVGLQDRVRMERTGVHARDLSVTPVGFIGIFFSTFFGGSTPDWASPKDQSASFKDFKLVINA